MAQVDDAFHVPGGIQLFHDEQRRCTPIDEVQRRPVAVAADVPRPVAIVLGDRILDSETLHRGLDVPLHGGHDVDAVDAGIRPELDQRQRAN